MRNRNVGINIRVSEKEKEKIVRNASKCQLTVSEYLRKLANGHEPKELPRKEIYEEILEMEKKICRAEVFSESVREVDREDFDKFLEEMQRSLDRIWRLVMSNLMSKAGDNDGNN